MDNLDQLLGGRKFQRPTEVTAMVEWCHTQYPAFTVSAQKRTHDYLLVVPNGALAQEVQMRLVELRGAAGLQQETRITIRIA